MTPIERAAKAVALVYGWKSDEWKIRENVKEAYIRQARATIAAIEEPSQDMIEAGEIAISKVFSEFLSRREAGDIIDCLDIKVVWRAMHQALMEEGK